MRNIVEFLIRIIRKRPNFSFDKYFTMSMLLNLIKYEGIDFLRGLKLFLFGKFPKFVFLGKCVDFQYISKIKIGKGVRIDQYCRISGLGKVGVLIGDRVSIGPFSTIITCTTHTNLGEGIIIGHDVGIGGYASIGGAGLVTIGEHTIAGQYLSIHPENHIFSDNDTLIKDQGTTRKGVVIGQNCWIGAKVTICDGVKIGNHCVIGAGAVVTKSFADYSVIGGVPARLLKIRTEYVKK